MITGDRWKRKRREGKGKGASVVVSFSSFRSPSIYPSLSLFLTHTHKHTGTLASITPFHHSHPQSPHPPFSPPSFFHSPILYLFHSLSPSPTCHPSSQSPNLSFSSSTRMKGFQHFQSRCTSEDTKALMLLLVTLLFFSSVPLFISLYFSTTLFFREI